jgi:hypothetical protein
MFLQSLDALYAWFDYSKSPVWHITPAGSKQPIVNNNDEMDMSNAKERLTQAIENFLHDGTYDIYVRKSENTNFSKALTARFSKGGNDVSFQTQQGINGVAPNAYYPVGNSNGGGMNIMQILSLTNSHNVEMSNIRQELQVKSMALLLAEQGAKHKEELAKIEKEQSTNIVSMIGALVEKTIPTITQVWAAKQGVQIGIAGIETPSSPSNVPSSTATQSDVTEGAGQLDLNKLVNSMQEMQEIYPSYNVNTLLEKLVMLLKIQPDLIKNLIGQ